MALAEGCVVIFVQVLSQRLALDTHVPQYLFDSANPLGSMPIMHGQIAKHMRTWPLKTE